MILVVGATGNIGKHVVALLHQRGVPVRAVSRQAQRAQALVPSTVEIVEADMTNKAHAHAVLRDVTKIYLATNGPDQRVAEANVLAAAQEANITHIVRVSVIGASPDHFVGIARVHHELDELLIASGIPATILRPNWFMENFFGSLDTITAQGAIYGSAASGRVAFIDSRDTAAVAVEALTGAGHAGKEYHVTGPEALTFAEAAEQLSAGTGQSITYVNLSDADFRGALLGVGIPEPFADLYVQINRNAREDNLAVVTDTVEAVTGQPARPLATFARDHAAIFNRAEAGS